ncbi:MAG: tautomerase family protein [Thermoleophilia bacterium]
MPIIEVKLWTGQTREQKAELAQRLTDATVAVVNCPAQAVTIRFEDSPQADWAQGGKLMDER